MPLDPQLARLIAGKLAHATAPQWQMPIADVRRAFSNLWSSAMSGEPAAIERADDVEIPGPGGAIRARAYKPLRPTRDPPIVYLHGGGYVKGSVDDCDVFSRNLAAVTQHVVLSVDYRLAPENPFPEALDDACAAIAWACEHAGDLGATGNEVIVAGESAGGNLAAVACLRARSDPRMRIRMQVLLQPVVDFTLSFPSIGLTERECLVPRDDLAWYYHTYYGSGRSLENPDVSPLFARSFAGLPPALIISAEWDTLRDEDQAYADRLRAAGVPVQYTCYPGMVHGFLQMAGLVKEAHAALEEIARFVNAPAGARS